MGWAEIYTGKMTRKEREEFLDKKHTCEKFRVIKSALVGTTYYAACQSKEGNVVWGLVVLTKMTRDGYFEYKSVSENCGPCEAQCPMGILDLLSPAGNIRFEGGCYFHGLLHFYGHLFTPRATNFTIRK